MNLDLKEKVAIVTGGGSGTRRGIAIALPEEDVNIIIADIDVQKALTVANEIEKSCCEGEVLAINGREDMSPF